MVNGADNSTCSIAQHRDRVLAVIEHGPSNGCIESVNTRIRLITRVVFWLRSPRALVAPAMLTPGRRPTRPRR